MQYADQSDMDLDRASLVTALYTAITIEETPKASRIISVVGEWGSGKSWVIQNVLKRLSGDQSATPIEFNPWLFGSDRALGEGFVTALLAHAGGTPEKRRRAAQFVQDFGPLVTPLLARIGVDAGKASTQLANILSNVGSPATLQKLVERVTKSKRFVVIMDDLDRLMPDELLTVFKLIRLVGDVPSITYVLAYDEQTLLHLIAETPIGGKSVERSRNYLEKVVEKTFPIPPLSQLNLTDSVLRPIVGFGLTLRPNWDAAAQETLLYRLRPLVSRLVRTPRAAHRYLDSIQDLSPELAPEIDFEDWCVSNLLTVFYPDVWDLIRHNRELMTGRDLELTFGGDGPLRDRAKELDQKLKKLLADRIGERQTYDAIHQTFSGWSHLLNDKTSGSPDQSRAAKSRSIAHPEFIDKYIWRSLHHGLISEAAVRRGLVDVSLDGESAELSALLAERPSDTLDAVDRQLDLPDVNVTRFLLYLEGKYTELTSETTPRDPFGLSPRLRTMYASAASSLDQAALKELRNGGNLALKDRELLAGVLTGPSLRQLPPRESLAAWVTETTLDMAREFEDQLSTEFIAWDNSDAKERLITLMNLDRARVQELILRKIEANEWNAADVAAIWIAISNRGEGVKITGFQVESFVRDLGENVARAARAAVIESRATRGFNDDGREVLELTGDNARLATERGLLSDELAALLGSTGGQNS